MRNRILSTGLAITLLAFSVSAQKKGNAEKGKAAFEQCAVCHNTETEDKKVGPSLKGLFQRSKLKNGSSVTDESVRAMINGGGDGMPSFAGKLSEEEKENLIAYLHTL